MAMWPPSPPYPISPEGLYRSKRNLITRTAVASVAAAGLLALSIPGVASAADPYPKPTVSATADGDVITTTVTDTADPQAAACVTALMPIESALPLISAPELPPLGDLINLPGLQLGTEATLGNGSDTAVNEFTVEPGAYAAVGACLSDPIVYDFAVVFSPGGIGSVSQGLGLGSTLLKAPGGIDILLGLLGGGGLG